MIDDSSDQLAARRAAKVSQARQRTTGEWKAAALDMSRALQAVAVFSQAALARPQTKVSTLAQLTEDLATHVLLKHGFSVGRGSIGDHDDGTNF